MRKRSTLHQRKIVFTVITLLSKFHLQVRVSVFQEVREFFRRIDSLQQELEVMTLLPTRFLSFVNLWHSFTSSFHLPKISHNIHFLILFFNFFFSSTGQRCSDKGTERRTPEIQKDLTDCYDKLCACVRVCSYMKCLVKFENR